MTPPRYVFIMQNDSFVAINRLRMLDGRLVYHRCRRRAFFVAAKPSPRPVTKIAGDLGVRSRRRPAPSAPL